VKSKTENKLGARSRARRIWLGVKSDTGHKIGRSWRHKKLDGRKPNGVQILY
jgi:hypothetical protein